MTPPQAIEPRRAHERRAETVIVAAVLVAVRDHSWRSRVAYAAGLNAEKTWYYLDHVLIPQGLIEYKLTRAEVRAGRGVRKDALVHAYELTPKGEAFLGTLQHVNSVLGHK